MARSFAGGTDRINATITDISASSITYIAWVNTASSTGIIMRTEISTGTGFQFNMAGTLQLSASVNYDTVNADAATTTALTSGAWQCVAVSHNVSTKVVKIYIGSLTTTMAEAAYSSQNTGSVSAASGWNGFVIGNRSSGLVPFTGSIAYPVVYQRALVADEIELYRQGRLPRSPAYYWPLTQQSGSPLEFITGATGTLTGTTYTAEPRSMAFNRPGALAGAIAGGDGMSVSGGAS